MYWPWLLTGLVGVQILVLAAMNTPWICPCGEVKLWQGGILNGQTSLHIADWYSPSHAVHGMLFFWLLTAVGRGWSVPVRTLLAAVLEISWEIFENTPWVIQRFRHATAAVDYHGDSIVNSVSDIGFMLLGFYIALKLPLRWGVLLAVALELLAMWAIRDNLMLQILTFIWPIDALVDWQSRA